MNEVLIKRGLLEILNAYHLKREGERVSFTPWAKYTKHDKIQTVDKLIKLLEDSNQSSTISKKDIDILKDGRLGEVCKKYAKESLPNNNNADIVLLLTKLKIISQNNRVPLRRQNGLEMDSNDTTDVCQISCILGCVASCICRIFE